MIEVQNVSKTYARGVYALRNLSLQVGKGDFIFLTGPSGAGKSHLVEALGPVLRDPQLADRETAEDRDVLYRRVMGHA